MQSGNLTLDYPIYPGLCCPMGGAPTRSPGFRYPGVFPSVGGHVASTLNPNTRLNLVNWNLEDKQISLQNGWNM